MLSHIVFFIFLTRVLTGATDVPPITQRWLAIGRENPGTFWQTESSGAPNLRELRIAARIIVYLPIIGMRRKGNRRLSSAYWFGCNRWLCRSLTNSSNCSRFFPERSPSNLRTSRRRRFANRFTINERATPSAPLCIVMICSALNRARFMPEFLPGRGHGLRSSLLSFRAPGLLGR